MAIGHDDYSSFQGTTTDPFFGNGADHGSSNMTPQRPRHEWQKDLTSHRGKNGNNTNPSSAACRAAALAAAATETASQDMSSYFSYHRGASYLDEDTAYEDEMPYAHHTRWLTVMLVDEQLFGTNDDKSFGGLHLNFTRMQSTNIGPDVEQWP